jgi:hypothetical protein
MLLHTKKHRESLSHEQKGQIMSIDATAHKKQYELLSQRKKARLMETKTEQCHDYLIEEEKDFFAQIRKNDDFNEDETYDKVLPHEKYATNQPNIPVSRESKKPIVDWTDNKTLFTGAFPDKFLFGQGVPNRLPTQQNW